MFRSWFENVCFAPDDPPAGAPPSGPAATSPNSSAGAPPATPPATPPAPTTPPAAPPPAEPQTTMPTATFNARLEQERRAGVRELLTALGFQASDPAAYEQALTGMRDLVTFAREQQRAQLTAEQRVQADLQTAQQQAQQATGQVTTLTAERDAARTQLRTFVLRSQIVTAAAGAAHPEDVYTWALANQRENVDKILMADQPLFAEDGTLNPKAINADPIKVIIEECKKARRDWFRPEHPGIPSNANAQPPTTDPKLAEKRVLAANYAKM